MSLQPGLSRGVLNAKDRLCFELGAMDRHRRGLAATIWKQLAPGTRLNLGCGPNYKPGWLNIDLFDESADVALDLREEWPMANSIASIVYSEHLFEHLEHRAETAHYLAQSYRVLADGGTLSMGVPDTEWPIRAYSDPDEPYWRTAKRLWHPADCETRIDHLNYHFRQDGEHKFAWDEETLSKFIAEAGFIDVRRREFIAGLDSEARRIGTLHVEAKKPKRPR